MNPEITETINLKEVPTRQQRWMTVIYNDDTTPIDLVIVTVMRATDCDLEEAQIETWEAHHMGKAPVHFASREECELAAKVISRIGVKTEVRPEWEDE